MRQSEQQRQRYGGHRARQGRTICAAASERLKPAYNKYRYLKSLRLSHVIARFDWLGLGSVPRQSELLPQPAMQDRMPCFQAISTCTK